MSSTQKNYAHIILPLAVALEYTYEIPDELKEEVAIGKRVEVQFGAKRIYAGIVHRIFQQEPPEYKVKPIVNVIDEKPILLPIHLKLWEWIANYYMCTMGEIMTAALPKAMKLSSETKVLLNPNFGQDYSQLEDDEFLIAEALEVQNELSIQEVQKILERKNIYYIIKSLIDKGAVILEEELKEAYQPKMEPFIALNPEYLLPKKQEKLFEELSRAKKQEQVLLAYLALGHNKKSISQKALVKKAEATSAQVNAMIKKGIFTKEQQAVDRIMVNYQDVARIDYDLTQAQQTAFDKIKKAHEEKNVVLLHGITSSGKTQIYIKLIQENIKAGKTILYLLPEIALTGQMINRLRKVFGKDVGIYHSKFNPQERVEIWQKVLKNEYKVIVGVRSSLFLPLQELGLIIVDEEHDPSYKQKDPAPRYNARDTAITMAHLHKAKVILGSATPSLESYTNALQKKYGFAFLGERFGGGQRPDIQIVNITEEAKKKRMKSHFSQTLLDAMQDCLNKGEQIILFKNRRGYSVSLNCTDCGYVPKCIRCDVSLTYHKYANDLKCHYCDYHQRLPEKCTDCESSNLKLKGFGTEKIEDDLKIYFPDIQTNRMDLETTRTKTGYLKILNAFEEKQIDVLVGTQMVTKGLDFANVGLVGVLSADSLLSYPDFRASERAFQLMLQVSGRTGRRDKKGKVLIQANSGEHPIFEFIIRENFSEFYNYENPERKKWLYPPFTRLIQVTLKHRDKSKINRAAFAFASQLERLLPQRISGPAVPPVSFVRNYFIRHILIKLPKKGIFIAKGKQHIRDVEALLKKNPDYKSMIVQLDVDPY